MLPHIILIILCVAADQAVKLYTVSHLALGQSAPLIDGFIELLYIQNTGGGFSILAGHTWILTLLTAALMAGLAFLLFRRRFPHPLAMWSLTLVLGGGLGNLIDRVRQGYVVDMFNFQFISYPVFNVADICIVTGVAGFAAYYLLVHDRIAKGKKGNHAPDSPDSRQ